MNQNVEQNDQLVNLVSCIKHISLNQQDLMDVSLEFTDKYCKKNKTNKDKLNELWGNSLFSEQAVLSAREGIVLAMQAITLNQQLPFDKIVENCINTEQQRHNEKNITENKQEQQEIKDFFTSLRKELFSRIYSQNKSLQKVSKIPSVVLKSRYDYFMNQPF